MPAFRKKPVVVEASALMSRSGDQTLQGDMQAQAGDWVIQGVKGELYPCKDDIFRETYEPVGKEGVKAMTAPGPDEPDDREFVIPFPRRECVVTAGVPLESIVTDA